MKYLTFHLTIITVLLTLSGGVAAREKQILGGVEYATAEWPENAFGNHRAVVAVGENVGDAVRARIPWRRHDAEFRAKAVLVYDMATGQQIGNALPCNITREYGDVVFEPETVPGQYAVYYMPYRQPVNTVCMWVGAYLPVRITANSAWLTKHNLDVPVAETLLHPVGATKRGATGEIGTSFELVSNLAADFADNDYTLSFEVRFVRHHGPFVTPTVLLQEDNRGYQACVYDLEGQLVMNLNRKECRVTPFGNTTDKHEFVKGNWDAPWPVDMDKWLAVTLTVKVLPEKTVVTSRVAGTGDDGQPFTSPLLVAEDKSPERLKAGLPPAFRLYPGDDSAGTWVRNVRIRDKGGNVVLDSNTARRGARVEHTATLREDRLASLHQARLVRMESRRHMGQRPEMNAFFPMEIIASKQERSELLARHADPVLLFPEDRGRPIVMPDFLPQEWAIEGPGDTFHGTCQPSEYYCWQIGVYAAREDVEGLSLRYGDVTSADGKVVIPAESLTCFNLEGIDVRGRPFTKDFTLSQGMVRPLWIGMMVPDDAGGLLKGSVKVRVNGQFEKTIRLELLVDGPVIANHGDDEPWRHSRLRWLNSTLGLDDSILPLPYTPVKRAGQVVDILNRTLRLGPLGLPDAVTSNGAEVLAAPVRLDVTGIAGELLAFSPAGSDVEMENPSRVVETRRAVCGDLSMAVRSELWFDGATNYEVALRSATEMPIKDVALAIPMREELARYFLGFSFRGDRRPESWQWKWSREYNDNAGWLGDVKAGIGLKLLGATDYWDQAELRWDEHRDWINEGKGGLTLSQEGDAVVLRAFTGERLLKAGEPVTLRFRLYVTPFKPLRPDHWNLRFFGNIGHYHHSGIENPYINYPFMTADALRQAYEAGKQKGLRGMTIYYTMGNLSNIAPELFAFHSLGEEVIKRTGAYVYSTSESAVLGEGGGHPWLCEHLVAGYSPGWQQTVYSGEVDAAVADNADGRLVNYYIEGLAWLQKKLGYVGVYLDGINYDRVAMMRLARTLTQGGSEYYLPFHSGDNFKNPWSERRAAALAQYMEHLPYVTQLMFGEVFWFSGPEGYWMTNLAGLPFGIDNQFYPVPGPDYPFRVMLYASSENVGPHAADIRAFWDRWGINERTRTLGYWDENCPVKTDSPEIFASVFANENKALICVGSWAKETTPTTISVDWKALGMDPASVRITVPDIGSVQKPQNTIDLTRPIDVEPGKGIVISIERTDR